MLVDLVPGLIDLPDAFVSLSGQVIDQTRRAVGGFLNDTFKQALAFEAVEQGIDGANCHHQAGDGGEAFDQFITMDLLLAQNVEQAQFKQSFFDLREPFVVAQWRLSIQINLALLCIARYMVVNAIVAHVSIDSLGLRYTHGMRFCYRASDLTIRFRLLLLAVLCVGIYLSLTLSVKRTFTFMDATTATCRYETRWFNGLFTTGKRTDVSSLEMWAREHDLFKGYDWCCVEGTLRTVFNQAVGAGHGPAPAIFPMRVYGTQMMVKYATDEELTEFMNAMNSGNRDQQEKAVDKMLQIVEQRIK